MFLNREINLQDVLLVEDDTALLEFQCTETKLPLWPQIRIAFFRMLMSDMLYRTSLTGTSTAGAPKARAATTMVRSMARNLHLRITGQCKADICIMTEGVANQWIDGKWFNRLADHFALACPERTLMVEDHFEWRWPFPRYHERTMLHAPRQACNAIVGRLRAKPTHFERARRLVNLVSQRSQRLLGWTAGPVREQQLVEMLARKSAAMPSQFLAYQSMFSRIQPKLVLIGAACYGPSAALIAAAREAGGVTAEYQHGAVSGGHDAYNFAPAIGNSDEYRRTLPHYFLGYGAWWNDQINAPVVKIPIGNPHRAARLAQAAMPLELGSKEDILFLSDGTEFEMYLNLAKQVEPVAKKCGLRVVVRPHPLERSSVAARYGTHAEEILIDPNVDLYASLRTTDTLVSEVSTGLFDAAGVVNKLLMWDTAKSRFGFPVHPFQSFNTTSQLLDLIKQDDLGRLNASQLDSIWAPHWHRNYVNFIAAQGVA